MTRREKMLHGRAPTTWVFLKGAKIGTSILIRRGDATWETLP